MFTEESLLGLLGEHAVPERPDENGVNSVVFYTCVNNGWRVIVWRGMPLAYWKFEAHEYDPAVEPYDVFSIYEQAGDVDVAARDGSIKTMRAPNPIDEVTMLALIYELTTAPNHAGLAKYPPDYLRR